MTNAFTEMAQEAFTAFYAASFQPGETLQELAYAHKNTTPPEYREEITGLDRERIVDMWSVHRLRVDSSDRQLSGYLKLNTLANLAQFSLLADELVAQGYFTVVAPPAEGE